MIGQPQAVPDVLLFEPRLFTDERGAFFTVFDSQAFPQNFVQENQSMSRRGVLRGLHSQDAPHAQGKLVRVVRGIVWDVAVDVRPGSPTFGRHAAAELSADNRRQLWIPPGFLHGFYTLSHEAEMVYAMTDYYAPGFERSVRWDDPDLNVPWPLLPDAGEPILSAKDRAAPVLREAFG